MKALITLGEFTATYGVSRSTAYRLAGRGQFSFVHIGRAVRLRTEEVERWYASLSQDAEGNH
jgi:excisionase family DNA binding protein